jgi:hypothetical protein
VPVPARVVGDDAAARGEPRGGLRPLAGVPGEAVQQQRGRAVAAEVEAREADLVAPEL